MPEPCLFCDIAAGDVPSVTVAEDDATYAVALGDHSRCPSAAGLMFTNRTSGEHRLSGFCPWQTAHAEVYVCPKPWPALTHDDFTEALRHYSDRTDPERHAAC